MPLLAPHVAIVVAKAPGRLDVMGGIADYSGSLVLQLPLHRYITATIQAQDSPYADIQSTHGLHRLSLPDLANIPAESLAAKYPPRSEHHWASYVAGVVYSALRQDSDRKKEGFRLEIESDVPEGKGISSSAALEVACYTAIAQHWGLHISPEQIAKECQWAENHIARAPCGIMDQMASACGRHDHLLRLLCQPASIQGHVTIPDGYRFYGIDSGIRHAVTGSDYGSVRTAAFMGYRITAELAGVDVSNDDRWHGYLANIPLPEFEQRYEALLPEKIRGAEFTDRYGDITDTVTRVIPEVDYSVKVSTAHPIRENARVHRFAGLLDSLSTTATGANEMGDLMYASHASYSACGLGSNGTDRLVQLARETGPQRGVFGAKITGGGSGGTVAIFASATAEDRIYGIADVYSKESGCRAEVFL